MRINKGDSVNIGINGTASEAVKIAAKNLGTDIKDVLSCDVSFNDAQGKEGVNILITEGAPSLPKEGYEITAGDCINIKGADRRGTVYGIYTLSEMLGVSPWYFFADVPKKRRECFELPRGFVKKDNPVIEYRGIFINDEEELDHWVKNRMGEETIGVKTYEKIFELLLRLKYNYIWPAMHVNSFNMVRENGALADRMGIIVGTSHCDMLMRSNHREWAPWLKKKGYTADYDYSVEGRNREILNEYWRESVEQNKDFEVTYTLGMRGIHDSGFEVRAFAGLSGEELINAKIELLETVINNQIKILDEVAGPDVQKNFVPYKEVLELYDHGLHVPEDFTLIWVNDNYGYVRRYPNEEEKKRKGGNGLYYHNSYWSPPGNSYLFIDTIPLAHTRHELIKAYDEGIRKLWITNFGAIKPLEEQMSFVADLSWDGNRKSLTEDVDAWLKAWLEKTFSIEDAMVLANALNDFDQLTNVRKVEHLDMDVFPLSGYGDEGAYRLHEYERIFDTVNSVYHSLPEDERDAFFETVAMKVHAAYFSNAMYYYADSSRAARNGNTEDTVRSLAFDALRKKMLEYYNRYMHGGKWEGMLTPEDFPPVRTVACPACKPEIPGLFHDEAEEQEKSVTNTGDGEDQKTYDTGRICIEGDSFVESSPDKTRVIKRLGRSRGNLTELTEKDGFVKYEFCVKDDSNAEILIHRFPTLNSVGRIRALVSVDDGEDVLYETEAVDEHKGTWKTNVQNNVDKSVVIKADLKKGKHTLKITAVDKYFSFSRIEIFTGERRKSNLGFEFDDHGAPREFDTEAFGKQFYGDFKVPPVKEVLATPFCGTNANIDYDTYRDGEETVSPSEYSYKCGNVFDEIINRAPEKPFTEKDGLIAFDAASALGNTGYAYLSKKPELIDYCNSLSHNGMGLALYVPSEGKRFDFSDAPAATYVMECEREKEYRLWVKDFCWGSDRSHFEVTIDDKHIAWRDFIKPGPYSFAAENVWRFVPVTDIMLSKGKHKVTVHFTDRRLRIDRVVFSAKDDLMP